jgi:hypothetical protein
VNSRSVNVRVKHSSGKLEDLMVLSSECEYLSKVDILIHFRDLPFDNDKWTCLISNDKLKKILFVKYQI